MTDRSGHRGHLPPKLSRMRVIVNFMLRDGMWLVHCIADDAKTVISPMQRIAEQDTLIHLLRYVGANDDEIQELQEISRQSSHGSVFITLKAGRKNILRIHRPWSAELRR